MLCGNADGHVLTVRATHRAAYGYGIVCCVNRCKSVNVDMLVIVVFLPVYVPHNSFTRKVGVCIHVISRQSLLPDTCGIIALVKQINEITVSYVLCINSLKVV